MKNKLIRFTAILTIMALPVLLIEQYFSGAVKGIYMELAVQEIHVLLYVLAIISFGVLTFFKGEIAQYIGFGFVGFSLLKMGAIVAFLWPMIKDKSLYSPDYILHFFALYFFYLIVEIYFVFRFLLKK